MSRQTSTRIGPPIRLLQCLSVTAFLCLSPPDCIGALAAPSVQAYELIGEAFKAADQDEWPRAERLIDQADDPLARKVFGWLGLVRDKFEADFPTLAGFIIANPDWPRLDDLQLAAEALILDPVDHSLVIKLFEQHPPLTSRGRIRYGEALIERGREKEGVLQLRRVWLEDNFSASEETKFLQLHGRYFSPADHALRLDNLLWDRRHSAASRMLKRVAPDQQSLAEARLALQQQTAGVDGAVQRVPENLQADPGLLFDRARWRRLKDKHESAVELLLDPPKELKRLDLWWTERDFQIRRAIDERAFDTAYALAVDHGQVGGSDYVEAEWLAGWLALRFANKPQEAFRSFVRLYDRVAEPVYQARAAYWAGRAAAAQDDSAGALAWYRRAAEHQATYYGQLAALEIAPEDLPAPSPPAPPTDGEIAAFEAREVVQVARLLIAAGASQHLEPFLRKLADQAQSTAEISMIGALAMAGGQPVLLARIGRSAAFEGFLDETIAFPIPAIPPLLQPEEPIEPSLLLALARQESMFDSFGASTSGAQGLLQLIPSTARIMATSLEEPYQPGRLVGDPAYNVRLGSHYLRLMLERFDGERALALAAYNAGPQRVSRWIKQHGDPRLAGRHATIDWIELIPFRETRSYVKRVLEAQAVYERRLASREVVMIAYPEINGPLDPLPFPRRRPGAAAALAVGKGEPPMPQLKPVESADAAPTLPALAPLARHESENGTRRPGKAGRPSSDVTGRGVARAPTL